MTTALRPIAALSDGLRPDSMRRQVKAAGPAGRDLAAWTAVVVTGLALTGLAVVVDASVGTASPPFTGYYRLKLDVGSLLAPAVAVAVLIGCRKRVHERLPWRWLLVTSYAASLAWSLALALVEGGNGLAAPLARADGYLPDVARIGNDPVGFLRHFVALAPHHTVDTRQHPPGPVLLLWVLHQAGITRPELLGLVVAGIGSLSVPLVGIAMRSLCREPAARALLPVLCLAPYAIWLAVSLEGTTLTVCAAALTCGVVGSERHRSFRAAMPWAAAAGLLLGVAALFSYSAAWLGVSVIVVYFVRRRPLLNVVSGATALVPLLLAQAAGFTWPDGLTAAQTDFSLRVGPHRSWLVWALLDVLLVAIACGPTIAMAARKLRRTPGWPFLVGAGLAVLFAIGSGLSRGGAERSLLPFFPWLLVSAVAPEPGEDRDTASRTPLLLVAVAAVSAIVIEAVLRSPW